METSDGPLQWSKVPQKVVIACYKRAFLYRTQSEIPTILRCMLCASC